MGKAEKKGGGVFIQHVKPAPEPLSSVAQAMADAEEEKRVAEQAEDAALESTAMREARLKRAQQKKKKKKKKEEKTVEGEGETAAAFFEGGNDADGDDDESDDDDDEEDEEPAADGGGGGGTKAAQSSSSGLLGVDIRETDGEKTTDNSVWEPDRLLA